mmetsp:Transcript_9310/g.24008  ORF Transcript_9310/g.24008 Transcript_9310/m.24008 type:complete len:212 (-) Transcript_9310:884-1519(-)
MPRQPASIVSRWHWVHFMPSPGCTTRPRTFRRSSARRRFDSRSMTMPFRAWMCLSSAISRSSTEMRSSLPSTSSLCILRRMACSKLRCTRSFSALRATWWAAWSVSVRRLVSCAMISIAIFSLRSSIVCAMYGTMALVCTSCCVLAVCAAFSVSSSFSSRISGRSFCHSSQIHRQYSRVSNGRRFLCSSRQASSRRSFFISPASLLRLSTA